MPEEGQETKRLTLMGPPRVRAGTDRLEVMLRDGEKELLALLVVGTLLLPPDGVWREIKDSQGAAGYEVGREWLVEILSPAEYAQEDRRQAARNRVGYLLDRMHPRGVPHPPLSFRLLPEGESRERGLARVTWQHLDSDLAELLEAAKTPHGPASQEKIMALAARPLLEGMAYPWLQRPEFRRAGAHLDAAYLAALCGRADSLLVLMENARADGRANEVYSYRTKVLPLLDRAADRLQATAGHLDAPELEALRPFSTALESLRTRASYLPPTSPQAADAADAVPSPLTHNLPSPVTSFVGREQERQDIRKLLTSGRLVTLTGMGGCGKTRLALQTAWELLGDWDSVRLVELAALTAPDQVPQAVATALGVTKREEGVSVMDALTASLQGKRTLLLLDNCEHLLLDDRSEGDDCGTFAALLLHAFPDLSVLATSRKPLNIDGEYLCPLSPLPFPAPDFLPVGATDPVAVLLGYDAAQLFVDRVFQFQRFALEPENVGSVAAICAALDGIPLSLELAAARVKALPLEEITKRLSDPFGLLTHGRRESPARHKTLRAVIDWSYDLLNEPEQLLLCRLSVFAGGWTLDAAEAVGVSEDADGGPVLDLLTSLVDKSLVVYEATSGRYRMLETVRHYAEDLLRESGSREETRRRHREYLLTLVEEAFPKQRGPDQKLWLERVEVERGNLAAALASYRECGEQDEQWIRLAGNLWWFWWVRGYIEEGRGHLAEALSQSKGGSPKARARALEGLGNLAQHQGDYKEGKAALEQSLGLLREVHDGRHIASVLGSLGNLEYNTGDYRQAEVRHQEGLDIFRELNDERGILVSLINLGNVAYEGESYSRAGVFFREGLDLSRHLKDERHIAVSLYGLANVARETADFVGAAPLFHQSLKMFSSSGDQWSIVHVLEAIASLAAADRQELRAARLWGASEALRERLKAPLTPSGRLCYDRAVMEARKTLGDEAFEMALAEGRAMSWEQAVALALEKDAA